MTDTICFLRLADILVRKTIAQLFSTYNSAFQGGREGLGSKFASEATKKICYDRKANTDCE